MAFISNSSHMFDSRSAPGKAYYAIDTSVRAPAKKKGPNKPLIASAIVIQGEVDGSGRR